MQVFNFVVLSVIIPPDNVVTRYISKMHLLIVSLYVSSNLNYTQKTSQGKREAPTAW